jgi:peptidoglycan/LPS O-acetylase OafA/YrhL
MIQRQQSLWLLLSVICGILSFNFPFYTGTRMNASNMLEMAILDGAANFFYILLTGANIVLALVTIFLYKDRKLQLRLAMVGIVTSLALFIMYVTGMQKFEKGNLALTSLLVLGIVAGFVMATRGIRKDQQLIKSIDKLR